MFHRNSFSGNKVGIVMNNYLKVRTLKFKLRCFIVFFLFVLMLNNSYAEENTFSFDSSPAETLGIFKTEVAPVPGNVVQEGELSIHVSILIPDGYKLYADKTSIEGVADENYIFGKVTPPPSVLYNDPFIGEMKVFKEDATFILPVKLTKQAIVGPNTVSVKIVYQGCSEQGCFMPRTNYIEVGIEVLSSSAQPESPLSISNKISEKNIASSEKNPFQKAADRFGFIGVIFAAFILGFTASLTPCVYPMIPITVSVIGAGSSGKVMRGFVLSVFYVLGLSLTYAIFGTLAAMSGGLFGAVSGNPFVRILVAVVFILMALSMFDAFFIQMPSSVSTKLQNISVTGSLGVFISGAVSGLIVGPCVGPMLVGLLVYIATLGNVIEGFFIMWSFALGMGILFLIIGTFSGAISALPKAGTWMEKIKHFFGLIMFAAALYFIMPLIGDRIFLLCVGGLLVGAGVFAGAFDSIRPESTGVDRLWKSAGIFCIIIGAGYILNFTLHGKAPEKSDIMKGSDLAWHENEEYALNLAKNRKKPLMIDFAADWCSSCKRIEKNTFSSKDVISELNRFELVKIDCTDSENEEVKRLLKKYNIVGLPSIIFFRSDGILEETSRITSYVGPEDFLKIAKQIR